MKPVHRSKIRLACGKVYYGLKRHTQWRLSGRQYVRHRGKHSLFPVVLFHHQTPLIRNLPKVDMQLQYNKVKNLEIAVRMLDNTVVSPGEIFSFWLLLGKPTRKKGYLDGFVLNNGKVEPGVGGGLCQLSNLIYWMTLHTPLTVIERWRHSHDVFPDLNRKLPFGSGATCSYPSMDLQIKNTAGQPAQLHLYLDDTYLHGEWRGHCQSEYHYQVYEAFHEISCAFEGQYMRHNILRRIVLNADNLQIADEFITENRAIMMYQPFLTVKSKYYSVS